jgi:hypothetical protein
VFKTAARGIFIAGLVIGGIVGFILGLIVG